HGLGVGNPHRRQRQAGPERRRIGSQSAGPGHARPRGRRGLRTRGRRKAGAEPLHGHDRRQSRRNRPSGRPGELGRGCGDRDGRNDLLAAQLPVRPAGDPGDRPDAAAGLDPGRLARQRWLAALQPARHASSRHRGCRSPEGKARTPGSFAVPGNLRSLDSDRGSNDRMLEGLFSAAAGMAAQQLQLDAVGNDIANVNTDGYKSERVGFEDLLYNRVDKAGTETTTGAGAAARILGRSFSQGALKETGNPLDLAIEGAGFLQLRRAGGGTVLTRNGALQLNADGQISDAAGNLLEPPIKVPAGVDASELSIGSDGTVMAQGRKLGRISLVTVTAPDHL